MKGYFAYIRVSTVKQGEFGSSLSEQRSSIELYASRHGLPISIWFEERETAAKQGRTQFNKMMNRLAKREAPGVIIHKIDRSARNLRDWARLGDLMDQGIDVRFAHESLDLGSRGGRLAADIQAVVAADYVRNLRQEIRKGIDGALKRGLYPLPAPIGYRDCGRGKRKEIDPVMGPLVRQAFELYATRRYTLDELREEMERRGLRSKQGAKISLNGTWKMLRQPFYIGLIHVQRTGETFEGIHDPIVPKALFDRCQAIMSGRSYIRPNKHDFAYSRLITCDACGRSLIGELQKGYAYYRCHTKTCRGTSLREQDVHEELLSMLRFISFSEEELGDLRDEREEAERTQADECAAVVRNAKLALGRCDDLLARLTDAYLDGTIEKELFEARKSKLLGERRGHLDTINTPPEESERVTRLKKLERANTALHKAETLEPAQTRDAAFLIMSNFVAQGKKLGFMLQFPFETLLMERNFRCGDPYQGEPRNGGTLFTRRAGASDDMDTQETEVKMTT